MRKTLAVAVLALCPFTALVAQQTKPRPVVRPAPPVSAEIASTQAPAIAWMDLAKTPPMGWTSWNQFACNVSEQLIREAADAMVLSLIHI